ARSYPDRRVRRQVRLLQQQQGEARARLHLPLRARHAPADDRLAARPRLRQGGAAEGDPSPPFAPRRLRGRKARGMIVIAGKIAVKPERRAEAERAALAMVE